MSSRAGERVADLGDVELFVAGEHHEVFRRLREESPVHWNEGAVDQFWALTRYDDVQWAYRRHDLFSSSGGAIVGGSFRSDADTSAGRMLVSTDLPRHRLLKEQIHPCLSAATAGRVSTQVQELVDRALARILAAGGGDIATELATELPAGALMVVLGIDRNQAHELIGMTRRMVGYRDEVFVDTGLEVKLRLAWLQAEIFEFFAELVVRRRTEPGDDLVSRLLTAEINGRALTEEEVFYNCMNVAVGGNETSSYTVCTGLLALIEHPEQYLRLQRDPTLLGRALDEMLRWSSTNSYVQRVARRDVERRGVVIRKHDSVTLWNVSANRDPEQFPDPSTFDIGRSPNRHLSYGSGLHRCVGAPIAQAEMEILFRRLLGAGVRFESAGDARRLRSNFILGITSLPVTVVA